SAPVARERLARHAAGSRGERQRAEIPWARPAPYAARQPDQIPGDTTMATTISIHSFRGGTGKSNTTANLAALLALGGRRVGVIDTDIQSPGIHVLFGLDEEHTSYALNDYLWGTCAITQAAYDVTARLEGGGSGQLFLIPSSLKA